jgi:hypothetical protein
LQLGGDPPFDTPFTFSLQETDVPNWNPILFTRPPKVRGLLAFDKLYLLAIQDQMATSNDIHQVVSATYIFGRVAARLDADETQRSLWSKLEQEVTAGSVSSARSYLRARFKELSDRVTAALTQGGQG